MKKLIPCEYNFDNPKKSSWSLIRAAQPCGSASE